MTLAYKTLVALAACSVAAMAQSNRNDADQRFRAKYGRSTPAVEAREAAEKSSTAYRDAAPATTQAPRDQWAEQRHRSKLGRATPAEEKRIEADKSNTAYREVTTPPANRWGDDYMRNKYGRRPASK